MTTTWDPAKKHSSIPLTNGDLTAEYGGSYLKSVLATAGKGIGKWVFRIDIDALSGTNGDAMILGWGLSTADTNGPVGGSGSFGFYANGSPPFGAGVSAFAVGPAWLSLHYAANGDLAVWLKIGAGTWNNSGGDPDAGTGGRTFSAGAYFGDLFPMASFGYSGNEITIDGAATGHGLTTFTPWDVGASAASDAPIRPAARLSHLLRR